MSVGRRGRSRAVALVLGLCLPVAAEARRVDIGDGMRVVLEPTQEVVVDALPRRHEGLIKFTRRLCGDEAAMPLVARHNGNVRRLLAGVRYEVPLELLRPDLQKRALEGLFERDASRPEGWLHVVTPRGSGFPETLWRISEWFTGDGRNYSGIREANALDDEEISPGQELVIPRALLRPGLASGLPAPGREAGAVDPRLRFGEDAEGKYARYELRAGEALYSSVVLRFTGRIFADDVNRLAGDIARRSGIRDVTDIPVGYRVKVPLDLLLPEYLPPDDPRRVEYEEGLSRSAGYANRTRSRDLSGVTIVLDAGHGGRDVGASISSVWESVYVYDIMLRVRRRLQATTAADVVTSTRDGSRYSIPDRDSLPTSKGHSVLTSPPYAISDSRVSSNLRWYLANSIYNREVGAGRDTEKIVFVSIHADSLHPSLRGAMVYVPGLLANPASYGKTGTVYTSRREVREQPRVSLSRSSRVRSEGLSRDLAQHIISSFRSGALAVHANKPIRDRVHRNRRAWVPAVLRFNEVPSKVLVEVCNLANAEDRRLIRTRAFRERVAEAIVDGILGYYGHGGSSSADRVATSR